MTEQTVLHRDDRLLRKKFYKVLIPVTLCAMVGNLLMLLTPILVSHALGPMAMTAIGVAEPMNLGINLIVALLGTGAVALINRLLGQCQQEKACKVYTVCLLLGAVLSLILCLVGLLWSRQLAYFLTASEELAEIVQGYIRFYLIGAPLNVFCTIFICYLSVDNNLHLATVMSIVGGVVVILSNVLFLFVFHTGLEGVAFASMLGNTAALLCVIGYLRSPYRTLHLCPIGNEFATAVKELVKCASPSMMIYVASTLYTYGVNQLIIRTMGADDMMIYTFCRQSTQIGVLLTSGLIKAVSQMTGVLYGEKDYYGLRQTMRRIMRPVQIICLIWTILTLLFPGMFAQLFNVDPSIPGVTLCLRLYSLSYLPYLVDRFYQEYYQCISQIKLSNLLVMGHGLVLRTPVTLIMVYLWGIYGVCAAGVVTELLNFLVVNLVRVAAQKKGKLPYSNSMLLPEGEEDESLCMDCTLHGTEEGILHAYQEMIDFCRNNGISERNANLIGLAIEELSENILQYGGHSDPSIDVCLRRMPGKLVLSMRDDGKPFDPVNYMTQNPKDEISGMGLKLVTEMASNVQYIYVMGFNNVTIEINV